MQCITNHPFKWIWQFTGQSGNNVKSAQPSWAGGGCCNASQSLFWQRLQFTGQLVHRLAIMSNLQARQGNDVKSVQLQLSKAGGGCCNAYGSQLSAGAMLDPRNVITGCSFLANCISILSAEKALILMHCNDLHWKHKNVWAVCFPLYHSITFEAA